MTDYADVQAWLASMANDKVLDLEAHSPELAALALAMLSETPVQPTPIGPPALGAKVTPETLLHNLIDPMLAWMDRYVAVPFTDEARVMLLTIAGQETNWAARLQGGGGPARGWWQFEKGGGVAGVLQHSASKAKIQTVCKALIISCDTTTVYEAIAWNGFLATAMARLLLWTDPKALPKLGDVNGAYQLYDRTWRPGAKRPQDWPARYQTAIGLVCPSGEPALEGADV